MREWNLGASDPLCLTFSADARLSKPNYCNDPTWELSLEGEEPPALTVQTTFGLRAGWLRLFPRFTRAGQSVTDPADFARPPHLVRFFPNLLTISFAPFNGIDVLMDYWVPGSETLAGRIRINNNSILPEKLRLELAGMLSPLGEGESLSPFQAGTHHLLKGRTDGLTLITYLTGAPQPCSSPYPALVHDLELPPGISREFNWALAALSDQEAAVDLARRSTTAAWEAETARIEMQHLHHHIDIYTGNPDWDAVFAFTQQSAYRLFFPAGSALPAPSFVQSRRIDQGYSPRGDGSDYPFAWNGQSALDAWYLSSLILPGAPELAAGLLQNFLHVQKEDGHIDWKPGLAGQRGHHLAQPLLAALACKIDPYMSDPGWLKDTFPRLLAFFRAWMSPAHDRDCDGFPEWDHPLQTGFEHNPLFDRWHPEAQGAEITTIESPALGAYLYHECQCLIRLAGRAGQADVVPWLQAQAAALRQAVEACWDDPAGTYRFRDFETHASTPGQLITILHGSGTARCDKSFAGPRRLLLKVISAEEATRTVIITIHGATLTGEEVETIGPRAIAWAGAHGRATTRAAYLSVDRIEVQGSPPDDLLSVETIDYTQDALSLLLPLWAGIPDPQRAARLIDETLPRYRSPYGIAMCPPGTHPGGHPRLAAVDLVWNQFIGEALLTNDRRPEAAALVTSLMDTIIPALKQDHAFRQYYHAAGGQALGERGSLAGLAPLGLFLRALGIEVLTQDQIVLAGINPFPWPITVQYRGVTILRQKDETAITYPNGQTLHLSGPGPYRLSRS